MDLGSLLIIVGIILAVVSGFVDHHTHRLLVVAVVLIGVGALLGAGDLIT